ncbi:hypothetical protein ACFL35_01540 [Candidatus Riflebacteria bacterium]
MNKVKVMIMASYDLSMRYAMRNFLDFYDPEITYKGKKYKIELGRIIAEPLLCGSDVSKHVDVLVDRTTHWNDYYKAWAQHAGNCLVTQANSPLSFANLDKHSSYDLMSRAMHPKDRLPTTVLLPQFAAYTPEQKKQDAWEYEQSMIIRNTEHGWHPEAKRTDWQKVREAMQQMEGFQKKSETLRSQFYPAYNYIADTMEKYFNNKYPVYLKKAWGGGGSDVYKINSLEELYAKYDTTNGRTFHIQEAIEDYEIFVRCMGIGPQILAMKFQPDEPLHQHYAPTKVKLNRDLWERVENYVKFINSYHRWTYNSYECLIKDGAIHPIDFANACPDSNFTSLHVNFPWVICALIKWFAFIGVTKHDLRYDMEQEKYLKVFNDKKKSQMDKYKFHAKKSDEYFGTKAFNAFCEENFTGIEDKMIKFYDEFFDDVIRFSVTNHDFPEQEHEHFYHYYKDMMDNEFRPNAEAYLTTDLHL